MTVLIDTSALLAFAFAKDANHVAASELLRTLGQGPRIIALPVLTELFYMTMVRISYSHAIEIFAKTRDAFDIVSLTDADMVRMEQIMRQYQDAEFDFTDAAIMAVAERLNVRRVCTFDRRDFSIFRPKHCDYLELLPL